MQRCTLAFRELRFTRWKMLHTWSELTIQAATLHQAFCYTLALWTRLTWSYFSCQYRCKQAMNKKLKECCSILSKLIQGYDSSVQVQALIVLCRYQQWCQAIICCLIFVCSCWPCWHTSLMLVCCWIQTLNTVEHIIDVYNYIGIVHYTASIRQVSETYETIQLICHWRFFLNTCLLSSCTKHCTISK